MKGISKERVIGKELKDKEVKDQVKEIVVGGQGV